ncbi:MAG TPA: hypothetical protein VEW48_25510 [Thermoanaerobaculia bacterium]|nr:hypothetical protein [Thermoanaerobaculia bacterium]
MTERLPVYHLAWHRRYVPEADRFLVYLLVPVWLGAFGGSIELEPINSCGRPLDKVRTTVKDLASPRRPEDTEGFGHPVETRLIRVLAARAGQAGHILPQIVPSTTFRGWARLELSETERSKLLKAGGAFP